MSKTTKITYKMYLIEIWKIIQLQTKIVIAWLRIYSLPFFIWFFLIYVTWYSCDRIRLISVGFIWGIRPVVLTHLLYSLHTKYIEMWYYYCICTNWVFTTSFLKIYNGNSIMYSPESIRQPNHDIYYNLTQYFSVYEKYRQPLKLKNKIHFQTHDSAMFRS